MPPLVLNLGMDMSGKPTPRSSPSTHRKRTGTHLIGVRWIAEQVWTFCRKKKFLLPADIQIPDHPAHSLLQWLLRHPSC